MISFIIFGLKVDFFEFCNVLLLFEIVLEDRNLEDYFVIFENAVSLRSYKISNESCEFIFWILYTCQDRIIHLWSKNDLVIYELRIKVRVKDKLPKVNHATSSLSTIAGE